MWCVLRREACLHETHIPYPEEYWRARDYFDHRLSQSMAYYAYIRYLAKYLIGAPGSIYEIQRRPSLRLVGHPEEQEHMDVVEQDSQ